jgi:hypothetical protein
VQAEAAQESSVHLAASAYQQLHGSGSALLGRLGAGSRPVMGGGVIGIKAGPRGAGSGAKPGGGGARAGAAAGATLKRKAAPAQPSSKAAQAATAED